MRDTKQPQEREEPKGTTLTEEQWIELMNKHDRFDQYAKRRRERNTTPRTE